MTSRCPERWGDSWCTRLGGHQGTCDYQPANKPPTPEPRSPEEIAREVRESWLHASNARALTRLEMRMLDEHIADAIHADRSKR